MTNTRYIGGARPRKRERSFGAFVKPNLEFNSPVLQRLRREAGYHGDRELKPTPVKVRIPLYNVGIMRVALSTAIESDKPQPKSEITLSGST